MRISVFKWLLLSVLVVALDQLTKYLISQSFQLHESYAVLKGFNLVLAHNSGAAFSFLQDAGGWQRWFFIVLTIGVVTALVVWLFQLQANQRWLACALALILGGAMGNFIDRLVCGYVVDFIDIYFAQWHFPAFNVADSAITIGAIMLVIDTIWFDQAHISTHSSSSSKN